MRHKEQDWYKSHETSGSSLDTFSSHLLSLPHSNETNLFMNHHPNGAIHSSVQDAPLALVIKPRSQGSGPSSKPLLAASSPHFSMPTNLSTSTREPSGSSAAPRKSSAPLGFAHTSRKRKIPKSKIDSSCLPVNLVRSSESDIHSSKDSDDSLGDDYDDDEDDEDDVEDEDSGSSLSG